MEKSSLKDKLKVFESFIWSIAAITLYQCVMQFFVYPTYNRWLGTESYGNILTLISIMSIISYSIGSGMNYSRIVMRGREKDSNGNYNLFLIYAAVICVPLAIPAVHFVGGFSIAAFIAFALLLILTITRMYSEVEYRLNVNFRGTFFFYSVICIGYVLGVFLLKLNIDWAWSLIVGEISGIAFVCIKGKIARPPFLKRDEYFGETIRSCTALSLANILSNVILHSDRLMINYFEGGEKVSIFYTASLLGKTVALLVTPLSSVILSYLTKLSFNLTKKHFALLSGLSIVLGAAVFGLCMIASPIFVKLLYPDLLESCTEYFALANLGQVLYFISNMLFVVALRFMKERWQMYINIGYAVLFFAVGIPAIMNGGLHIFAWAIIIANAVRLVGVVAAGLIKAPSE